jgi:hypothetical protein
MTSERWSRVQEVFQLALECEPRRRGACLDVACSGDRTLREEVDSLLACEGSAHGFLDAAVHAAMDSYRLAATTSTGGQTDFQGTERFSIQNRLGSGGFGMVYRAYDRERNVTVALKTLHHLDASQLFALKREFRILADISHPNLVQLYELISDGQDCFFIMELVEGVNFREYATNSDHLRESLKQLVQGVTALHTAGKLHRDLKPSNVLVTNDGRLVILDFGLITDTIGEGPNKNEPIAGTPAYMSPEQRTGLPLSEASDWYSVGIMLYEALTGNPPAAEDSRNRPLAKLAPGVPQDLRDLCDDLLNPDPRMRPSGREICKRLGVASDDLASPESRLSPFVGRGSQLQALMEAFESTKAGRGAGIYLHGGSGAGKTTLAQWFLTNIQRQEPVLVLTGRCYERDSVPYKAIDSLIDALSVYLKSLSDSMVKELVPDISVLACMFPVLRAVAAIDPRERDLADPQERRRRGFAALRELLTRLAKRSPVILFIDDLQWGDSDSAILVAELLRPPDAPAVLLMGCYRTEEAGTSPFLQTLSSLQSGTGAAHSVHLALEDLSPPEARELASALLGTDERTARAEDIAYHCGGNPFFISELARHAKSQRELEVADTEEPTLSDLVRVRLSLLPEQARRFLEIVVVAGQPIDPTVARRAFEHLEDDRAILAVLRARHLIRVRITKDGQEVETYHDRIRETLTAGLSVDLARDLHLLLGRALETAGRYRPDLLATHFAAAGCRLEALHYAIAAADEAAAALAFDSAARFCRMALELEPTEPDAVLSLQRKLGEALGNAGRGAEAAEAYITAADLAAPSAALEDRRLAAWQYLISGHVDQGRTVMQTLLNATGLSLARTPRRALVSLLLGRARIKLRGLHYRVRSAAEISRKDLIRVDTCSSVSQGLGFIDTIHAADFHARHILLALRTGEKYRVARALCVEAGYHGLAGTRGRERTDKILRAAIELSSTCDNPHALGLSTLITGTCAFLEGRWEDARESFARAETLLLERCVGSVWELATARLQRSACSFLLGEWNELRQSLPALLADADARGDLYLTTALRTRLGHVTPLAADRPEEALEVIRSAIAKWSVQGFHTQHWWSLTSQCDIFLYQRSGLEAWNLMNSHWPALRSSMLLRVQYFLIESLYHRACSALAFAADSTGNSARKLDFVQLATRDAARIMREHAPWGDGLAYLVRAGALATQGQQEAAEPILRSAENALESADMHLFATAARRRRGETIKGDEGKALIEVADRSMRQQGIQSPERIAWMLAPGYWS